MADDELAELITPRAVHELDGLGALEAAEGGSEELAITAAPAGVTISAAAAARAAIFANVSAIQTLLLRMSSQSAHAAQRALIQLCSIGIAMRMSLKVPDALCDGSARLRSRAADSLGLGDVTRQSSRTLRSIQYSLRKVFTQTPETQTPEAKRNPVLRNCTGAIENQRKYSPVWALFRFKELQKHPFRTYRRLIFYAPRAKHGAMRNALPVDSIPPQAPDRGAQRRNLFVTASLLSGDRRTAVRIRNLSLTGALLECGTPLRTGGRVTLRRGSLQIAGQIVWTTGARAGMVFDELIDLAGWIPGAAFDDQMEVDRSIAMSRIGGEPEPPAGSPAEARPRPTVGRIVEELEFVSRRLEVLGNRMAHDPSLIIRHSSELQQLDVSVQTLGHLARVLAANCSADAVTAIGMSDLRRRLEREYRL